MNLILSELKKNCKEVVFVEIVENLKKQNEKKVSYSAIKLVFFAFECPK